MAVRLDKYTFRLDYEMMKKLRVMAIELDTNATALVGKAIKEYIERHG